MSQPAHLVDLMVTCVDVAGAAYSAQRDGEKIPPMEGVSLQPAFAGKAIERAQPLCWEHESNRAIRDGQWKLVAKANQPWELYDLAADRTEMHNLADSQPEKVKELAARWQTWPRAPTPPRWTAGAANRPQRRSQSSRGREAGDVCAERPN